MKGRIFSGSQPTGNLHLGNYLGALRNWVTLQHEYECIYCIVDMHAITAPPWDAEALRRNTREVTAAYLAAGVDPARCGIFAQSNVPGHAQLAWVFNCVTPIGWLNRMTQFKEKAGKDREGAMAGLYVYPVLMAADILLYRATHVPVGEDQKQHLELSRDIAAGFNRRYGAEFFPLPEPMILGEATRVMSLRDGRSKMSKSDPSDQSRLNLTDDADTIARKIRRAKSDPIMGVTFDPDNRPEASNLLTIYAALAEMPRERAEASFAEASFSDFKPELADRAVAKLAPINAEMRRLLADPGYIDGVLRAGAAKAGAIAEDNLARVYDLVGFLRP
jgi:tryptophanyl-tRNA synthetase